MSDLPDRESLKRNNVTLMDLQPIAGAYVRGDLKTRDEMDLRALALAANIGAHIYWKRKAEEIRGAAWGVGNE